VRYFRCKLSRVGQLNIQIFGHGKPISFTNFPDYGHLGPVCDVKPDHPPVTDIGCTGEVRTAWRNVGSGSGNMLSLGRLQCCGQCRNLGGIAFGNRTQYLRQSDAGIVSTIILSEQRPANGPRSSRW